MIICLSINLNIYFGCSKELSHRDGSFEYPQHMFCLKNKIFFITLSYLGAWSLNCSAVMYCSLFRNDHPCFDMTETLLS